MASEPALSDNKLQHAASPELLAKMEQAQNESIQLRREVLRWKILAKQHESKIKEMESSVTWKMLGIVRILPELKHRWKLLLLVAILALVSAPLWPLLLILICFTAGRDLIWRVLWRIKPLRDLMGFIRQRLLDHLGSAPGEARGITPLIYHRPKDVELVNTATNTGPTAKITSERRHWLLLQQLCPQRRFLLQDFGLTRNALVQDEEAPQLLSLSRAELSLLRISCASRPTSGTGSARPQ